MVQRTPGMLGESDTQMALELNTALSLYNEMYTMLVTLLRGRTVHEPVATVILAWMALDEDTCSDPPLPMLNDAASICA
jgi:hypothetical protein